MEVIHVRYFLALCDEENFTRAAKLCGVSQPSLSKVIRSLENKLGGALFERKPRVRLSALGQSVRPHFEAIWREVMQLEGLLRGCGSARASDDPIPTRAGEVARPLGIALHHQNIVVRDGHAIQKDLALT